MSGACETRAIPNVRTRKHAFILGFKACRKQSKLLPRCCSSGTIQRYLTDGPFRETSRSRRTATCSPVCGDWMASRMQTKHAPAERAARYLRRIARLTGAKQISGGGYWLRAGRRNFLVDCKFVRTISDHGKSTCFSVATDPDLPSAERVAYALLQLKNNPKLFKKWRKRPGYMFKADGQKFRGAEWLAGMGP